MLLMSPALRSLLFFNLLAADTISSIEFNENGEFLAAGDKGGRIVVFKRDTEVKEKNRFDEVRFLHSFGRQ
jgi:serine/threonine-protein phosphatase 2A regulatory subunit B